MPIYEYFCPNCQGHCELLQKVNEAPATHCPHCQKDTLTKCVSAPSFQLKGTGWYVTDFRGDNKEKPKKSKESSDNVAATSSETTVKKDVSSNE